MTFELWRWADLAQNLISSSTPGGAPLYQVWWKSTQRFLRFRVNEVKIAYLIIIIIINYFYNAHNTLQGMSLWHITNAWTKRSAVCLSRNERIFPILWSANDADRHFCATNFSIVTKFIDLWPLTLGGSRPKSNQFIYSGWGTPVPSLMKIHPGVLEISRKRGKNSIFIPSSLTFDPGHWADLAQNLISSSTPGSAPLYQVWWKSSQGFLRFRVNEVKIAYLYQIHWPLTLDVGRISPKI